MKITKAEITKAFDTIAEFAKERELFGKAEMMQIKTLQKLCAAICEDESE